MDEKMNLLVVMVNVFLVVISMSWLTADRPYWALMLMEDGFTVEEIGAVLTSRNIVFGVLGISASIGLLLVSYYLGERCKLTRGSTVVFVMALIISIIPGVFLAYWIKQFELPQYPILNWSIILETTGNLSSPIIWCMLGMLAGNYKREIEEKRKGLAEHS